MDTITLAVIEIIKTTTTRTINIGTTLITETTTATIAGIAIIEAAQHRTTNNSKTDKE